MSADLPWLAQARRYLGVREVPGKETAPAIWRWMQQLRITWLGSDEAPWCGTFCGAMMLESATPPPPAPYRALSWLQWGTPLAEPAFGCIVVFRREGGGHVGFVVGQAHNGDLLVLGGNQGDRVSIAAFPRSRVAGYRWPAVAAPPVLASLPVGTAALSTSEA